MNFAPSELLQMPSRIPRGSLSIPQIRLPFSTELCQTKPTLSWQPSSESRESTRPSSVSDAIPLRTFISQAWPVVEPGMPFLYNWHIDVIADHLEALYSAEIPEAPHQHPDPMHEVDRRDRDVPGVDVDLRSGLSISDGLIWSAAGYARCPQVPPYHPEHWYQEKWGSVFCLTTEPEHEDSL